MVLNWLGPMVAGKVHSAVERGLTATAAQCVAAAMQNAPVDTGALRSDITFQPAQTDASGQHSIQWGNFVINYALWQEIGSQGRTGRYYLRRAADSQYPHLKGNIRKAREAL